MCWQRPCDRPIPRLRSRKKSLNETQIYVKRKDLGHTCLQQRTSRNICDKSTTETHNFQSVALAALTTYAYTRAFYKNAAVASSSQNFPLCYRRLCVGTPAKTCRNRILFCKPGHISGTSRHESEFCGKWMSQEPRRLYGANRRCQPQCRLRLPRTAGSMCLFRAFQIPYLTRQSPDFCSVFNTKVVMVKQK